MPSILILAALIELVLIVLTSVFLTQPKLIFGSGPSRVQSVAYGAGLICFCLTFCWSVVLGILLHLNGLTIKV
ncbi:hypothetical protein EBS43_10720 [bacterium]|jgi:hypothetical protein|nr:hypothetical protein [bacterium]